MSKLAILFPGQGSQSVGMMKALNEQYPLVKQRFQEASDIVKRDLWVITQENTDDFLNRTEYTQPIMLTASYITYEILVAETGVVADYMTGHSLGEYTALTASGALSFAEAVHLVHMRGQLMQEATPHGHGAMAAILGLNAHDLQQICANIKGDVWPANYNSPEQIVIGGLSEAVKSAMEACKERGAKRTLLLPVSVPSHTPLMRPAAVKLGLYLDKVHWSEPKIPVIFNVDAQIHQERYGIEGALGKQLYEPVLWTACVDALAEYGVSKAIEVGPGKVLSGLVKRINTNIKTANFEAPEQLEAIKNFLAEKA